MRVQGLGMGDGGSGHGNAALLDYLRSRRWFGEKGAELRGARLVDVIPVQWDGSEERFLVARARVDAASPVFYQLFLREGDRTFGDALESDAFRRGVVEAFAGGCTLTQGHARWVIESESSAPFKVPADADIRLSKVEQSNSSVIIGSQAILKLFRRLEPGVHPDLEVTRFLTVERRFLHTPALLGTIHFVDTEGVWAAGMLQELVPGATDGWTHALSCAREWFERPGDDPPPFVGEAERLGGITREMHEALASGDPGSPFAAAEATAADVSGWADATVAMLRRALKTARREGDAAVVEQRVRAITAAIAGDAGSKIRIHGDYHLGQVLRSVTNAFLVVDFEGEPARPLEQRRAPHSPLKDVAGMLRSFGYAAATLGGQSGERRDIWERAVREAFLRGYFAGNQSPASDHRPPLLPRSRAHADALIALFEIEKAYYELQYELDHRPGWAWIPEAAIARLAEERPPSTGHR
jgi:maltokinase